MNDPIEHPIHYNQGRIEAIDAIREALGKDGFISYCRGNAMKYVWRTGYKDDPVQDMKKAVWYLNRAIKEYDSND